MASETTTANPELLKTQVASLLVQPLEAASVVLSSGGVPSRCSLPGVRPNIAARAPEFVRGRFRLRLWLGSGVFERMMDGMTRFRAEHRVLFGVGIVLGVGLVGTFWQAFLVLAVLAGVAYLLYRLGVGYDDRQAVERRNRRALAPALTTNTTCGCAATLVDSTGNTRQHSEGSRGVAGRLLYGEMSADSATVFGRPARSNR